MTDKIDIARAARQLLSLLYKLYCQDDMIRRYGMYPWSLTERSGISFADGGEALAVVYLMWRYGWIRIASPKGKKKVTPFCSIQLTLGGIKEAQSNYLHAKSKKQQRGFHTTTTENINHDVIRDFHN
jgi:hypothetical protein